MAAVGRNGTVSTALVRMVLGGASRLGIDAKSLMQTAGVPSWTIGNDDLRVATPRLGRLWEGAVAQVGSACLGLRVANHWQPGSLHVADYLFLTAATLREALAMVAPYERVVNDAGCNDILLVERDGYATIRYQVRGLNPIVNAVASEFALAILLQMARHATGREITPALVEFATAAPPVHGELIDAFGTSRINFDAVQSAMTFTQADLDAPLRSADPVLAQILRQRADALLGDTSGRIQWIDRFRRVLNDCLEQQDGLLRAAAGRLALSPRTLQRRLEQEGTSWRAEMDAARRDSAWRMLSSGIPKETVALCLGYSDDRVLRRAIHRWGIAGRLRDEDSAGEH
jgi:AraC-like DNA-binding protein